MVSERCADKRDVNRLTKLDVSEVATDKATSLHEICGYGEKRLESRL